ncbi:MAG TPA: MerR family DNA-binding transcriptional regulator [Burkholderiales bacterium]
MTTFTITDLAKEYQITTRAIRFYEDQGLLAPARSGRNRVYSKRDRVRVELILRSKRLGFSLVEIKELFDLYDSAQGDKAQLKQFLKVLSSKRVRLGEMKKDIEVMLSDIDMFEAQNKRILEKHVHAKESV